MKTEFRARRRALLMSAAAPALALALMSGAAQAQSLEPARTFAIDPQPLADALLQFSRQADIDIVASAALTSGQTARPVQGDMPTGQAMAELLAGTGLQAVRSGSGYVLTRVAQDPQGGGAAGGGAEVDALIVTAQKREENIQDVPIAMSAFSQEDLTTRQVAGGPDLITQVPNMTFTKTNFASYSIQIRGIGTQAISATTDAAVAVALNNTPFIRNRFFEQEFYDLERIEVLRGPQGTLYGRNATAGVVNIITAKPKFAYEAKIAGDIANYRSTRLEGMINLPLVEDVVALRLAGAWTKRDGFVTNEITGNQIDGRDLWSTRVSLRFAPTDAIEANLIWEHFEEDDDRLRSGKQLCKRDDRTEVGGRPLPGMGFKYADMFNQGCLAESMYSPGSFQAPNGFAMPYYHPLGALWLPTVDDFDPYSSTTQSRDLRVIESTVDPQYRAKSDLAELQVNIDLSDTLTLTSETAYGADALFSTQDFNRFSTARGAFADISATVVREGILEPGEFGPVFCDPQIGCADRLVAVDLSTAKSRQFSQEFRLGSDFDGPFNFSLGANFLRYDTEDKYYVFINTLTLYSTVANDPLGQTWPNRIPMPYVPNVSDNIECLSNGPVFGDPNVPQPVTGCIYIDPNPISSLNDMGHNYFLSRNPYKLISYAAFGEAYYNITPNLKLTAGLRMTVDKKEAPRIPSWLLAAQSVGYPVAELITQEWKEPTGRLTLDWNPDLGFTDDTLLYASYAHGYKAGGANPPGASIVSYANPGTAEGLVERSAAHPKTFAPEFIDAYEIGAKNTMFDGRITLNAAAFYYDYKGYQISQIVNRSAVNLNFDAKIWGLELEADFRPVESQRLGVKVGYENTRMADGSQAIDLMDRTAGNDEWIVVRPFPSFPSNCILPLYTLSTGPGEPLSVGNNVFANGNPGPCEMAYIQKVDPRTGLTYVANPTVGSSGFNAIYPGYIGFNHETAPNNGEGFYKNLSGNELPNAPQLTGTLTLDYTTPVSPDWLVTLHGDLHYQSESWARIFNTDGYDKIKAYTTLNLAVMLNNDDAGWRIMAYVKNVLDHDAITGSFLNSDDTMLTTNVFLTEPRLYGLRVTKDWTGGSMFGGLFEPRDRAPGAPYPFWVEVGASTDRFLADNEAFRADFLDEYEPTLQFPLAHQNQDLDRGDQRDIKLTYAPQGGWSLSAALRYGRVNGSGREAVYEQLPGGIRTAGPFITNEVEGPDNYGISTVTDGEDHKIADFMVGKEVGLGFLGDGGKSVVSGGLRYAQFNSRSNVSQLGTPDNYFPATGDAKYANPNTHTEYEASLDTERSFEGWGPMVSWDASRKLLGDDVGGRLDVDLSVGGGVLFGKQTSQADGERYGGYKHYLQVAFGAEVTDVLYDEPIAIQRSEKVTVSTVGASLGLSYSVDRVKVSGGYRWERYFDALDGGYEDAKAFDRGFDGPYFKLAVGFGG